MLRIAGRGIVGEDTGHRLQVADVAVDDAEERENGGLVSGDAVEVAHYARRLPRIAANAKTEADLQHGLTS